MRYADRLEPLLAAPGVLCALVVARDDGIVVDGNGHIGVDTDAVAALAASLYARAAAAADASDGGAPGFLHLEGEAGRLCIVPRGDLLLVTVAEPHANLGLLRLAMRRQADALAG